MSPSPLHQDVAASLRAAYDGSAATRSSSTRAIWQLHERESFLKRLLHEGRRSMFEVGAGAGQDSRYFADHGIAVVATDLSPQMVAMCRSRGIEAHVMDVLGLSLPHGGFDAAYAMNSLLHVPNADFPEALGAIHRSLEPGGLLYLGVYGGEEPFEGVLSTDWHDPKRFFSFRTDSQLLAAVVPRFQVVDFHVVTEDGHFQALTLRALA